MPTLVLGSGPSPDDDDDEISFIASDEDLSDGLFEAPLAPHRPASATFQPAVTATTSLPTALGLSWKSRARNVISVFQGHYVTIRTTLGAELDNLESYITRARSAVGANLAAEYSLMLEEEIQPQVKQTDRIRIQLNRLVRKRREVAVLIELLAENLIEGMKEEMETGDVAKVVNFLAAGRYDSFPTKFVNEQEQIAWQKEIDWLISEGIEMKNEGGKTEVSKDHAKDRD